MKKVKAEERYTLCIVYNDGSELNAEIIVEGTESAKYSTLLMICRGTLMATTGKRGYIYNSEGFEVCAYVR